MMTATRSLRSAEAGRIYGLDPDEQLGGTSLDLADVDLHRLERSFT
jgi:hypothetical protein